MHISGGEIHMPISIDEFMQTATPEQKELLLRLCETAEKEHKCAERINKINSFVKSGAYSPDGYSITLCEDEDDAKIISGKDRQELQDMRDQISTYLKKAVVLHMGHLGIIQRNYTPYVGEPLPA